MCNGYLSIHICILKRLYGKLKRVLRLVNSTTSHDDVAKGDYKKSLKALLPYGMLATKKWLAEQGLSAHAIDTAVKTETLLLLATGVYSQYSRSLSWEGGGLYAAYGYGLFDHCAVTYGNGNRLIWTKCQMTNISWR